ncbi:MAG: hypothetical protein E7231_00405 [Cellulosilyticum sp.]|nr:hypothetical protein [Cellulosilyticum sp.]
MKVRALIGFACIEATLSQGQETNLSDEVAKDLITCGYVESLEEVKKTTKKKVVKKDESK